MNNPIVFDLTANEIFKYIKQNSLTKDSKKRKAWLSSTQRNQVRDIPIRTNLSIRDCILDLIRHASLLEEVIVNTGKEEFPIEINLLFLILVKKYINKVLERAEIYDWPEVIIKE